MRILIRQKVYFIWSIVTVFQFAIKWVEYNLQKNKKDWSSSNIISRFLDLIYCILYIHIKKLTRNLIYVGNSISMPLMIFHHEFTLKIRVIGNHCDTTIFTCSQKLKDYLLEGIIYFSNFWKSPLLLLLYKNRSSQSTTPEKQNIGELQLIKKRCKTNKWKKLNDCNPLMFPS